MDGENPERTGHDYRTGIIFGLIAYGSWGLVPLYFYTFRKEQVGPLEILAHRIVWSLVLLTFLMVILRGHHNVLKVLTNRKTLSTMMLSAILLTVNWLLYIYSAVTGRVTEASLGYYMLPLVNAFLATMILGEKLRPLHYPALVLVGCGVAVPFLWAGDFTWLAVALPVTFAIYGLVRKRAPVDGLTGLTIETLLMVLPSAGYLIYLTWTGQGSLGRNTNLDVMLVSSALVTVIPLVTFAISLKRMTLVANSFLQFLSPTIQFILAVYWLGEVMAPERWAAIGLVWVAVVIFMIDAFLQVKAYRVNRREAQRAKAAEEQSASRLAVTTQGA